MFWLIRLIFFCTILSMGYSWVKWKISREPRWRRHFFTLFNFSLILVSIIVVVLFLTRLLR